MELLKLSTPMGMWLHIWYCDNFAQNGSGERIILRSRDNRLARRLIHFFFVSMITLLLSFVISNDTVHGACNPMTYREFQDSAFNKSCGHGSVIIKDNNVWVYNEAARRRFAMPEEWRDDGLTGAELAAFRIEPSGRQRCYSTGVDEICFPSYECVLELYIRSDTDIGITGNPVQGFIPWKSSLYVLGQRNPELRNKWEQAFGLKNTELLVDGVLRDTGLTVMGYDTTLRKDLTMVTMFIDGRVTLLPPETNRVIRFALPGKGGHQVEIPESFWRRVIQYHYDRDDVSEINWRGGTERDTTLWAYTKDFAQRYNMSVEGIDEALEGALAVSYSLVPTGQQSCGYFSDPSACSGANVEGIFDIYFDKKLELPFPTYDGILKGEWGHSYLFLREQYANMIVENKIDNYEQKFKLYYYHRSNETALEKPLKWYGGSSVYFDQYVSEGQEMLDMSVLTIDMTFKGENESHEQNFLYVVDSDKCIDRGSLEKKKFHKIHIPLSIVNMIINADKFMK